MSGWVVGPVVPAPANACEKLTVGLLVPFKLAPKSSRLLKTYAPEKLPGKKFRILSWTISPPNLKVWRPRTHERLSAYCQCLMVVLRGLKLLRPTVKSVLPACLTTASGRLLLASPGSASRRNVMRAWLMVEFVNVEVTDPVMVSVWTSESPVCCSAFPG